MTTPARRPGLGVALAAATALGWLGFLLANGPAEGNDTAGYLRLADGLAAGHVLTSFRTPGYPLFVAAVRGAGAPVGLDGATVVVLVQTLLLAGLGTWLVYDLGVRLTARPAVGAAAAVIYAVDADLQQFGMALLTEALTVVLALATLWLRVRDGTWQRAAFGLAVLALVRPNFAVFPVVFAALDGLRVRRAAVVVEVLWPTAAAIALWFALSWASGANPLRPYQWFVPMHTFGTVYEAGLWQALPDGPERQLLERVRARSHDPYQAAAALERELGEGTTARVGRAAVRADRAGYAWARARLLRQVFRQGSWMRRELVRPAHPNEHWIAALGAWREPYRGTLYASFPFFVALLAGACWRGLGWPDAVRPYREVLGPFVGVLFVSTALSSLSNYDLGRLGLAFHPVNALLWAMAVVRLAAAVRVRARPV